MSATFVARPVGDHQEVLDVVVEVALQRMANYDGVAGESVVRALVYSMGGTYLQACEASRRYAL